jgi:hypothetical protein|tara:strand:+ start:501 stop:683 length:183 start_codon:yes stop_codon:yes gene_type:complete
MSYVENRSGKEITDREIQLKVLKSLQDIRDSNNTIKDWATFFGIMQILGVTIALLLWLFN